MTDRTEEDFASAAMMRLVVAGLARQGLGGPPAPRGARVPQADKRAVLTDILDRHGPHALLSICDAATDMPPEPVVQALTRARDIPDLLDRWGRLERFSHGRHRVRVEEDGVRAWRMTHHARDGGPPPAAAESLLVLGLLAILSEIITGAGTQLTGADGHPWRKDGVWVLETLPEETGFVRLSAETASRADSVDTVRDTDPVADLKARILRDPVRRWSLSEAAVDSGLSVRTLQRRLGARSLSYSRLVTEARLAAAAAHLCDPDGPGLAEIGFLAGYADQAHFSRIFGREVGITPRAYRADFRGY